GLQPSAGPDASMGRSLLPLGCRGQAGVCTFIPRGQRQMATPCRRSIRAGLDGRLLERLQHHLLALSEVTLGSAPAPPRACACNLLPRWWWIRPPDRGPILA